MKVPLLILAFLPAVCFAQNSEKVLEQYSGLGLPLICITTADGKEPTSSVIYGPIQGETLTDIVPKEGRMQIYRCDTLWYDSGEYQEDVSGMRIRHRCNTSAVH